MNWDQRFVVFDCETTGLNAEQDHLVSVGAVVVEGGEICLGQVFETLVRVPYNSPTVVVHGVTREASLAGLEEPEAVRQFLVFAGASTLVGHHVGFDLQLLRRIAIERLAGTLHNRAIDTMEFMIDLAKRGAFGPEEKIEHFQLDDLCRRFQVKPHDRHTAAGDAFLTAQVFLKLLRIAKRTGIVPPHLSEKIH